jgi:hypothetical protein
METNPSGGPKETLSSSSPLANLRVPRPRCINLELARPRYVMRLPSARLIQELVQPWRALRRRT